MTEKKGDCVKADFIFDKNTGLSLYLDFEFDRLSSNSVGASVYVTDPKILNHIHKLLTFSKKGLDADRFDKFDLVNLIGKHGIFVEVDENHTLFKGFDEMEFLVN